ncbi:MAG: ROK family protein [Candidatus Latescibacteria bacterium]|nr:ROK family protein [Candidatus Latescibacterota bacterium]
MKPKFKYKMTIETGQIITPCVDGGIFSSIGNKPAKLHIGHDGCIAGWDRDSAINAEKQIGYQNCIIGPGFIDIHFHGYGDQSNLRYSEIGSFQNPVHILEKVTTFGTTSCLSTIVVPAQSRRFFGVDLDARFKLLRSQLSDLTMKDGPLSSPRARLLGIHLEGPKINPEVSGAIPQNAIWDANIRDIPRILGKPKSGNDDHGVRLMTIAPEMDFHNDFRFIRAILDQGIVVSLGHSAATLEQTIAAIKTGARHLTHFFNAMGPLFHRKPGIIGSGLVDPHIYDVEDDRLSLEIICDFIHVNPAILQLAMSRHHLIAAVSDAVAYPGMGDGTFEFVGQRVTISDGAVRMVADGRLSGSVMTMNQTFRNLLLLGGDNPDIVRAFEITSTNPSKILGINDTGVIEKGRRADLVVLDKDCNLLYTIVNGEIAYDATKKLQENESSTIILKKNKGVPKPSAQEAVIGIRISAYAIWCGYVTNEETVNVTIKELNGNPRHKQGFTGREAILDSAAVAIVGTWRKAKKEGLNVTALGIATSGLVDGTCAIMAMNLPGWKDFDIAQQLLTRIRNIENSFPENIHVAVENSSNAMAMAIARTKRLRNNVGLKSGENFVFVKIGHGLGTGVIVDKKPISCVEDIAPDYYFHLRQAITNVHNGLPTLLHETFLINRLVAKGELALMRTCDDEFPELHLEALVSRGGIIHYAREEERRTGKIFFRKNKIHAMMKELERDPYAYENTRFELELTVKDIMNALKEKGEASEHAAAVFEHVGMALGSGIYSLTNTIEAPIRNVVIIHQLDEDLSLADEIFKKAICTSLSRGNSGTEEWNVAFIRPDVELFVLSGASLCYE